MYQSPIKFNLQRSVTEFGEKLDAAVWKAVMQVGISVDKEELLEALEYDRNQYEQGYQDAIRDKDLAEVVHGHWDEDHWEYFCSCCQKHFTDELPWISHPEYGMPNYCPNCGAKMDGERKDNDRE